MNTLFENNHFQIVGWYGNFSISRLSAAEWTGMNMYYYISFNFGYKIKILKLIRSKSIFNYAIHIGQKNFQKKILEKFVLINEMINDKNMALLNIKNSDSKIEKLAKLLIHMPDVKIENNFNYFEKRFYEKINNREN